MILPTTGKRNDFGLLICVPDGWTCCEKAVLRYDNREPVTGTFPVALPKLQTDLLFSQRACKAEFHCSAVPNHLAGCSASDRSLQRFVMISGLATALLAVLDGFGGAVADAGHAVGAGIAPDGLAVLQGDVIGRAALGALTAVDAGI